MKALLVGGCRDGLEIEVPDDKTMLVMTPEPLPLTRSYLAFRAWLNISPDAITPTADLYLLTSIRDDGTRVFEAGG